MQPQHPAQIRAFKSSPWQQARMVHRTRDGRWMAALDDGTAIYAADVRINHRDAAAAYESVAKQVQALGEFLRHMPVSARPDHYYDACRRLAMAYGDLIDAAQQVEVSA